MPRKPRLPEPLRIEGLSGQPIVQATQYDDFEPTKQILIAPTLPNYPKATGPEVIAERKAVDRARAQAFLDQFKPKQIELVPKGKRKIGELNGKAVLINNAPWRRI